MREEYILKTIDITTAYNIVLKCQRKGYRLAAITATGTESGAEVIYSLVHEYEFENYKIIVPDETEIPSISDIYPSAALFENEIRELFGVKISAINLDFKDKFYRIKAKTPFRKVKEKEADEVKDNETTEVKDTKEEV